MPGGNDSEFNALYQIACQSQAMASAAGGTPFPAGYVSEDDLVLAIACNFRSTYLGLGGVSCNAGWVDTDTAWQAILLYASQLTELTGTGLNAGNMQSPLFGIMCDLGQVATNTGTAAEGLVGGSYLNLLNSIACAIGQIVTNGFGTVVPPPTNLLASGGDATVSLGWDDMGADSYNIYRGTSNGGPYTQIHTGVLTNSYDDNTVVNGTTYYYVVTSVIGGHESGFSNQDSATPQSELQQFINSLLPYAPDLLIVADIFVGSNGDPVASAPDSSGNNNPMVQATALRRPAFATNAVNGKSAYTFAGGQALECPFPGDTHGASVVVYNSTVALNTTNNRIATLIDGINGNDTGASTPIHQLAGGANLTKSFFNGFAAQLASTDGTWVANASWLSGAAAKMLDNGGNTNSQSPSAETADPATYAAIGSTIGGIAGGDAYFGKIAFHARWAVAPSDGDIAAFLAIVNNYYGL